MKQETSSAVADAALWMTGCGIQGVEPFRAGFALLIRDLTPSYVVKKAPAV